MSINRNGRIMTLGLLFVVSWAIIFGLADLLNMAVHVMGLK